MRISRRQFIASSAATGVAGMVCGRDGSAATSIRSPHAKVSLRASGDARQGYQTVILFDGQPVAQSGEGEFSAVFQNSDRSLEQRVQNWRATSCTGTDDHLLLEGECKLPNLNATVFARVEYRVVTPQVVRKQIRFHQIDMYELFYQVSNRLEPLEPPASVWSFDQVNCRGGALREYFPAAGFRTNADLTLALLTDSGYRNGWSRLIRRDGKPTKPAPRQIPDVNLYYVSRNIEGEKRQFFVQQTFGEALVREENQGSGAPVALPAISDWRKQGDLSLEEHDGTTVLSIRSSRAGVVIPFSAKGTEIYSLRFRYRSPQSFSVQVWDADKQLNRLQNISLYNDRVPESLAEWSEFQTEAFFPSLIGDGGTLYISMAASEQDIGIQSAAGALRIEIRELQLRRLSTGLQPYHRLEMDRTEAKTSFIFVDDGIPNTLRDYRLASQRHLADGLGFRGSDTEKVLYSDLLMLCWSVTPEYGRPMVAPSIWYSAAGEMYMRDSFFTVNGIHNRELNEGVFDLWAANQGENGAINTLVEPYMANLERKSNDSTPLWLMWALLNRTRFGTVLPMERIRRAAEYCLQTYDRRHDGICWAQFVMGQLDVIDYPEGVSELCENQGMLAVTLRVIKALNIPGVSDEISEGYIEKTESVYRSYYDPVLKFVRPTRKISDAIGFGEIFPEFLSLWLFGRKILTDEMMINHLDRIPVLLPRKDAPYPAADGTVRPIFIGLTKDGKGWDYFTDAWHPMISKEHAANYANHNMDGIYYNGGSWMRIEICGYVAGKLHGWTKADQAIPNRLWAEINIAPDFPTSQEYLATDPSHPFFGYHRVFAWNAFVLQALEMAGLRTREMDPDHQKHGAR
ncbi:MAG: hypothetical protein JWN74_1257 [Acidobacteriaceae bacterium]|nr:hypothetical protein [Acidobacteriaceae bacterium]